MRRIPPATLFGVPSYDDQQHRYETSWLLPPLIFACLRGLIAVYIFATIITIWAYDGSHGDRDAIGQSFSYFTWLTFWGLGFYFVFATLHTALYARTGGSVLLGRWPRALRALHALLYTTITTYPFLVTIVYWGILFKPPWFVEIVDAWSNISQHGLNSLYATLEIILPATAPHPWIFIPFIILILLFYLCIAYITYSTESFYTYSFLDPGSHGQKSGTVTGYCFGILAAILVIFVLSWSAIRLRVWLTRDRIKRSRLDSGLDRNNLHVGRMQQVSDMEEVETKTSV